MYSVHMIYPVFLYFSGDLLGSYNEPASQAPPTTATPTIQVPNLLDISESTVTTSAGQTSLIASESTLQGQSTSLLDDLSMLDSNAMLSGSGGGVASSEGGGALMMYEGGSVRVPSELAQYPVSSGWDNKVLYSYKFVSYLEPTSWF